MTSSEQAEARRLIETALDDTPPAPAGIRPDIAALLARHADEADHYKTSGPYVPQPATSAPATEPMPGWMKGTALMAPTVGGGIWLAGQAVSGVMNAASPAVAACLAGAGVVVWLAGRTAAKRGPKKVVNITDLRGATVTTRRSSGIAYKSNNN